MMDQSKDLSLTRTVARHPLTAALAVNQGLELAAPAQPRLQRPKPPPQLRRLLLAPLVIA